jgi:transcription elongation factor Elf1
MANRAFVVDVQDRVTETQCPSCGNSHLEFELRCDLAHSDCLAVARCTQCQAMFDVDADSFLDMTEGDLSAGRLRCPRCHGKTATLALACSTSSHSCRYTVSCSACQDVRSA